MKIEMIKEIIPNKANLYKGGMLYLHKVGHKYFLDNQDLDGREKLTLKLDDTLLKKFNLHSYIPCNATLVMKPLEVSSSTNSLVAIVANNDLELMEWLSNIGGDV